MTLAFWVGALAAIFLVMHLAAARPEAAGTAGVQPLAGAVTLAVVPGTGSVEVGKETAVSLEVQPGTQLLDGVQVEVRFPAALLEVVDADTATSGVQVTWGAKLSTHLQNTVDNATGSIKYAAGIALGAERISGTFELASVKFKAKAGGSAAVQFSGNLLVTNAGNSVSITVQNGVITVQAPASPPGGTGGGGGSGDSSQPQPTATAAPPAAVPAPPQVQGPAGGIVVSDLGPTLTWQQPPGTTWYHVRVIPFNLDGPGINLIIGAADLVALSKYQVAAPDMAAGANFVMLPGMSYRWEVRVASVSQPLSEDAPEWSGWAQGDFRTPLPSSATLSTSSPAEGATVAGVTPRLTWANSDPRIYYYEIQVSKDATFTTDPAAATAAVYWELVHGGVTSPRNTYAVSDAYPLEPGSQYSWRVRPRVQGDGVPVPWSTTWSFRTP